jgi:hypothetical protein
LIFLEYIYGPFLLRLVVGAGIPILDSRSLFKDTPSYQPPAVARRASRTDDPSAVQAPIGKGAALEAKTAIAAGRVAIGSRDGRLYRSGATW